MDNDPIQAKLWEWERLAVQARSENEVLRSQLAHAQMHVENLQTSVHNLSGEVAFLSRALDEQKQEVTALKTTLSWRITAPLRSAKGKRTAGGKQ